MSVSSINAVITRLQGYLTDYPAAKLAIMQDERYSQDHRNDLVNQQYQDYQTRAYNSVSELWGAVLDLPQSAQTLDPKGMAWVNIDRTEKTLSDAKNTAERAGIDPAFWPIIMNRAQTTVKMARNPRELERTYKTGSRDLQLALQEAGAGLLASRGEQWIALAAVLENDRNERLLTPAVKAAESEYAAVLQAISQGYDVTRQVVNLLGATAPANGTDGQLFGRMWDRTFTPMGRLFNLIHAERTFGELPIFARMIKHAGGKLTLADVS